MAIKFNCQQCNKELIVKDDMAGKLGKCPNCKSTLTVPAQADGAAAPPVAKRVDDGAAAPPVAKRVDDDVVVATVVDDVVVADVVDDEDDAPVKKRRASRDDDDEDEEDDGRRSRPRKKSSRRDDDDDDEDEPDRRSAISTSKRSSRRDDDDEDDRPRNRRGRRDDDDDDDRPRKGRSRRDDDDEDDRRDRDPEKKKKRRAGEKRRMWEKASTGMMLHVIGAWVYAGAWGCLLLTFIIALLISFTDAVAGGFGGSVRGGGFAVVFVFLGGALYLGAVILGLVGDIFLITTPGKHGEKGLAITSLAMHSSVLLCCLLLFVAWGVVFLLMFLELARLSIFCFFMWAMCKSLRACDSAGSAIQMGIMIPCVAVAAFLLNFLLASVLVSGSATISKVQTGAVVMMVLSLVEQCAAVGLMYWYGVIVRQCSSEID